MKIELFTIPGCIHAEAIKIFLRKNNLPFKEIIVNNQHKEEFKKLNPIDNISTVKVTKSYSIGVCAGFNEFFLNQLVEHINKYKPKIKYEQKN